GGRPTRDSGPTRPRPEPYEQRAWVVPRSCQSRLVRLARPEAGRLAAEQLEVLLRRAGVDARRAERPVLPAQLPPRAARSRLVERGRSRGLRRPPPLLVRTGHRRFPDRRGTRPREGQGAARQPACA